MRARRSIAAVLASSCLGLGVPAIASAENYCVDDDACVGIDVATLASALSTAQASGEFDTITIGPGTYSGPFAYSAQSGGGGIQIFGAGSSTILTAPDNAAGQRLVRLIGPNVEIQSVAIAFPAGVSSSGDMALSLEGDADAYTVSISSDPATENATGVRLEGLGPTLATSTIDLPLDAANGNLGISSNSTASIEEVTVEARTGISHSFNGPSLDVTRSTIIAGGSVAGGAGAEVDVGGIDIDDSVIELLGTSSRTGLSAANMNNGTNAIAINARHVTIASPNAAGAVGLRAIGDSSGAGENATVLLADSIIDGPAVPIQVQADNGETATVTASYSNYNAAATEVTSDKDGTGATGTATLNASNQTFLDPGFADASSGDYSLAADSALIDAGDPDVSGPLDDRLGNARVVDGDGDGVAVRDLGAFERPDTFGPETLLIGKVRVRGHTAKVTFREVGPEAAAGFECKLDKRPYKKCTSPARFKRLKPGRHKVLIRAIDAFGNADATPVKAKFRV